MSRSKPDQKALDDFRTGAAASIEKQMREIEKSAEQAVAEQPHSQARLTALYCAQQVRELSGCIPTTKRAQETAFTAIEWLFRASAGIRAGLATDSIQPLFEASHDIGAARALVNEMQLHARQRPRVAEKSRSGALRKKLAALTDEELDALPVLKTSRENKVDTTTFYRVREDERKSRAKPPGHESSPSPRKKSLRE